MGAKEVGLALVLHGLTVVEYDDTSFQLDQKLKHEDPQGTPIHYMSVSDLQGLIEAMGSLPDLIYYLNARANLNRDIRSWFGAEQDLYACYLLDGNFDSNLTAARVLLREI